MTTPDQLLLTDRCKLAIQLGEGHFREFKSALHRSGGGTPVPRPSKECARDVAETLVAFANADGGELLFGVEDDGRLSGVPHSDEQLNTILSAPHTHVLSSTPLTTARVSTLDIEGHRVLYFQVSKGTSQIHQTSDGRCLQRLNTENRPVPLEHIRYERLERRSREWDREFVDGASLTDLDRRLVQVSMAKVTPSFAMDRSLQYLDLLVYDGSVARLRRAALLLFASDINRWHPRSQVRIVRVVGNKLEVGPQYNVQGTDIVQGNILSLVEDVWATLRQYLAVERKVEGGVFRETILYPEAACREAIVNAIVHRDYSSEGTGIDIFIFNDRFEVVSPGGLLSDVSLEALRRREKVHQSRNAYIARVLRELGYVRELGEGIPGIFHVLELHDLVPAELTAGPHTFSIALHHESIFSPKDRAWLESYESIPLKRDEQRVLLFARDRKMVSPDEITRMLGIVDWDEYRQLIATMQWKGLLVSTMTDAQMMAKIRRRSFRRKREIPRLAAREPAECVRYVGELLTAISRAGLSIAAAGRTAFGNYLSQQSPYAGNLQASLVALELLDEQRKPTARLLELLGRISERVPAQPVAPRTGTGKVNVTRPSDEAPSIEPLIQELLRVVRAKPFPDDGIEVRTLSRRVSPAARGMLEALGGERELVDFLSRQRDRFTLKWLRNSWRVFPAQVQSKLK